MKKIYTLKNDIIFHLTFCTKDSKNRLLEFLKRIYRKDIKDIVYEPIILNEKYIKTKNKYVDLLVTLDDGNIINIELNSSTDKNNRIRNFCYITNQFNSSVNNGNDYKNIKKHVQINFTWGLSNKHLEKEEYKVRNNNNQINFIDNFEIIEYNMDKILKYYYNEDEKVKEAYKEIIMLGLKPEEINVLAKGDLFMKEIEEKVLELNTNTKYAKWISAEEEEKKIINTIKANAEEKVSKKAALNLYKQGVSKEIIASSLELTLEQLEEYLNDSVN